MNTHPVLNPIQQGLTTSPRVAHRLFIDGKWVDALSGDGIDIVNPSTGQAYARVAAAGTEDVDMAVGSARRAFQSGPWARMKSAERALLLTRLADAIEAHADEIALIESTDGGNPVTSVRSMDITMAVMGLRYQAGWATKLAGETPLAAEGVAGFAYTLRQPIGVAGLITPWNAPFLMAVNKLGAALAAGCTCVLKPSELAPMSTLRLGELIEEVGFPPGVVNIVCGLGDKAGAALVAHPGVNKISFTGSERVGKFILQSAAFGLKRVTLELGGKSPIVVFPDADIEKAALSIANELIFKTGQFCAAGTRLFVHSDVFSRLVDLIAQRMTHLRIGPGPSPETEMGPLISDKQLARVLGLVDAGRADGATVVCGGNRLPGDGYFVDPTLLIHTRPDMSVDMEEVFGPVLCAVPFSSDSTLDQVAGKANDTRYGLAAKIWTSNLSTAHQMARKIHAGSVVVNGGGGEGPLPFGGFKHSGLGRENGREGVLSYTEIKAVSMGL
jgi:phenylacetaldehyde dehydrogenase